jgi:CBS domain containing-hemolysin-like protein
MTKIRIRSSLSIHGSRAQPLLHWYRHSERLLTTVVIGNNIVNTAAASIMAMVLSHYIPDPKTAVWVNTALMTTVLLVFGEILPKQIGKAHSESVSLTLIRPMVFLSVLLRPLVWVFGGITHGAAVLLIGKQPSESAGRTELQAAVAAAGEEGTLAREEHVLLEEALKLRDTTVREVMTPRVHMVTLARAEGLDTAKRLFAASGFSRIPVTGTTDGDVVGVLFAKDLLLTYESADGSAPVIVADLMRQPIFVPDVIAMNRLIEMFRRHNTHLLIVVGEYGDVVGLVTMEDMLEKLVGEIEDEFDQEESDIRRLSDRRYLVKATTRLDAASHSLGIDLPEGDYETVGGYLNHVTGRIPAPGSSHRLKDWLILVYEADERHVREVTFQYLGRLPVPGHKPKPVSL